MDEQFVHEDQMRNARTQGVGSMVSEQNRQNALELMRKMHKIDTQNAAAKARIESNLDKALQCVDNVRDFVGSPEHILGNPKTKHGEIAENVDVWFHNADQIMHNRKADATFEGVGRTVATDYKVHGVDVQSKYINGANNSLSHVLKHMEDYIGNYEAFGKDGYYVIPKDQYELIQRVLKDDKEISSKTARAINEKLEKIKELSGNRELGDIIRPGEVDYAAVQQGKIHETLDKKTDQLNQTADNQKQRADERSDKKREQAQQEAAPSLQKAGKAAAEAAFISGGFQLVVGIYSKCKEGKKINEFTVDDWKDIGIDTAKAAAEGGISGFAIYSREKGTISNCTFVRVSNCIREMGVVQNCVFENCSNVVNNCGYMVRENLFNGCKQACVDLQKKAIVSNCQFANCTGFNLITSTTNSEVKIEDCEFSNISTGKINSIEDLNNFGAQEYFNGNAPHDLQMLGIKGSVIEFGAADKKFANANHPNKIVRCIFNNIHICPTQSYYYNHGSWKVLGTENQSNFMISVKIFEYEKFDYPRAVVSDCSFTNCFAASDSLINEYFDFKPVFSKNRYYRLIRQENNYGLNNMRNPSDFVESNNVKLKETNASGKKIGSSMPVEWDDSEYTTCKMATTWLNTFNKA